MKNHIDNIDIDTQ